MAQASAAANRILSFRVREKHEIKATSELQDTEGGVKIELRDLWFKYPTRDIPIFTGLNLTIENGQFAALVGPSGTLSHPFSKDPSNLFQGAVKPVLCLYLNGKSALQDPALEQYLLMQILRRPKGTDSLQRLQHRRT